jgi:hypothetical protein
MEIEQHDAGFLVAVAAASDRGEASKSGANQLAAVACNSASVVTGRPKERRNIVEAKHQLRARDIDPWYHTANASSLSDWSLADRGMERRFALREPATGC